jgi:N-carbamoyl-L-amino-acid hydrolase
MDERMRAAVHRALTALRERAIDIPSGAGHDAMCLSRIAPAAMIFVPSAGGVSHVAQERTEDRDLELGVKALAAALVEVDRTLS